MKAFLIGTLSVLGLAACATPSSDFATSTSATSSAAPGARGAVTVAGIPASQALGAIDTSKLVGAAPQRVAANQPAATDGTPASGTSNVIAVEGVAPSAVLAAIDPTKLISNPRPQASVSANLPGEVQAVVDGKKRYTTKDLADAQLKAVKNDKAPG